MIKVNQVNISVVQFELSAFSSFKHFAQSIRDLIKIIPQSDFVIFPELFTCGLVSATDGKKNLTYNDFLSISLFTEEFVELFSELSKLSNSVIIAGSHIIKDVAKFLNTSFIFYPNGAISKHAKTHLFPPEREYGTSEGDDLEVFEWKGTRFSVLICYEMEIPECATIVTRNGAEIIFCPSLTVSEHGFWRVRHSCQARAIENQIYVVHCCCVGELTNPPLKAWGKSSILTPCDIPWNPNGVLAEAIPNRPYILRGSLNIADLASNRHSGAAPTYKDRIRKLDLYRKYFEW